MKTTTHLQETVEILISAGAVAPGDRKRATTAIEHDLAAGYLEPLAVDGDLAADLESGAIEA